MTSRFNRLLIILIAAITVIGAVVWDVYSPYTTDDYQYRMVFSDSFVPHVDEWPCDSVEIATFADAARSAGNHLIFNGRLANLSHIFMQPLGRTAEAVFLGLCMGAMFVLMLAVVKRYAGRFTPLGAAITVVAGWIAFPWYEEFQSFDFQFNYVVPTATLSALIYMLPAMGTMRRWQRGGAVCLAIATAWLNEGFGCVALAYMAVCAFADASTRRRDCAVVAIGLVTGVAINFLLGTAHRVADTFDPTGVVTSTLPTRVYVWMLFSVWPFALYTAVLAVAWLCTRKGGRRAFLLSQLPFYAGAAAGVAMALVLHRPDRTMWPADMFCAIGVCIIAATWCRKAAPRVQVVAGIVFVCLYGWWMTQLCIWNKRIGDEHRQIEALHGPHGTDAPTVFFMHHTIDREIPFWLMTIVRQQLDGIWGAQNIGTYLQGRISSVLILPPDLEGKTLEEWPEVPGNNNLRGIYPMMAARDSAKVRFIVKFGEITSNISPANRALMFLKSRGRVPATDSIAAGVAAQRIILPDGSTAYRFMPEPLPRTVEGRRFVSIDIEEDYSPDDERSSR